MLTGASYDGGISCAPAGVCKFSKVVGGTASNSDVCGGGVCGMCWQLLKPSDGQ